MVGHKKYYNNPRLRVSLCTNENRFPNAHIKTDTIWCDSADILESDASVGLGNFLAEDFFIDFCFQAFFYATNLSSYLLKNKFSILSEKKEDILQSSKIR